MTAPAPRRSRHLEQLEQEQRLWWRYRRLTSRFRRLPELLIIGAQRSGSTSTYSYLVQHPRIRKAWRKEVRYFDSARNYANGEAWYRTHFSLRGPGTLAVEATPEYIFHPDAPVRMARLVPQARLIALLRDPVERAISHYHHSARLGHESRDIETAMAEQPAARPASLRAINSYLARGLYAEQLEAVLQCFPRDQLLVLASEELFDDATAAMAHILGFVGLSPAPMDVSARKSAGQYAAAPPALRARLVEFFRPHNARLYDLLGRDLGWAR